MGDALLHVAVTAEDPRVVRLRLHLRREREADAHRDALAERPRRDVDAADLLAFGMSRRARAELAEVLHLVERQAVHPREMEERVDERTAMAARKDEPVAVGPERIRRIDLQVLEPQRRRDVRLPHRTARMTGVRLFDHIRHQHANRVRRHLQITLFKFHDAHIILGFPRRRHNPIG